MLPEGTDADARAERLSPVSGPGPVESLPPQTAPLTEPAQPTRSRARRWGLALGSVVAALVLLLVFAPMIVANTALRQRLPALVFPAYPAPITIGRCELSWWSGVTLEEVVAYDEQGGRALTIERLTSDQSLWTLIFATDDLGAFRTSGVEVVLTPGEDGFRLESPFKKFLQQPEEEPGPRWELFSEGRLLLTDAAGTEQTSWPLQAVHAAKVSPDTLLAEAEIGDRPATSERPVRWLKVRYGLPADQPPPGAGSSASVAPQLSLASDRWDVAPVSGIAQRWLPRIELGGELSTDLVCQPDELASLLESQTEPASATASSSSSDVPAGAAEVPLLQGQIGISQGRLVGWPPENRDRIQVQDAQLEGLIVRQGSEVELRPLAVRSDFGTLSLTGRLTPADLREPGLRPLLEGALAQRAFALSGQVDLSKLAEQTHQTLAIRDGVSIEAGQLTFSVESRPSDKQHEFEGSAKLGDVVVRREGQSETWTAPFEATGRVVFRDENWRIESLTCRSEFLTAEGAGSWDDANVRVDFDLARLQSRLSRWFELPDHALSGRGAGHLELRRADESQLIANGELVLSEFAGEVGSGQFWREPRLKLSLDAVGTLQPNLQPASFERGELRIEAGTDHISCALTEPINWPFGTTADGPSREFPAALQVAGDLGGWLRRLQLFTGPVGVDVAGSILADAKLRVQRDQIAISSLTARCRDLAVGPGGQSLIEREADLSLAGAVRFSPLQIDIPRLDWNGTASRGQVQDLKLARNTAGQLAAGGQLNADVNLAVLNDGTGSGPQIEGLLSSQLQLASTPERVTAIGSWSIVPLAVRSKSSTTLNEAGALPDGAALSQAEAAEPSADLLWIEDRVAGALNLAYAPGSAALDITRWQAAGLGWDVSLQGRVFESQGTTQLDLQGKLSSNWADLSPQLSRLAGTPLGIAGVQERAFGVRGPLNWTTPTSIAAVPAEMQVRYVPWPMGLTAKAEVGWLQFTGYGLTLQEANLPVAMKDGVVSLGPATLNAGSGTLHLQPRLSLATEPQLLMVPEGVVIDHVNLSPELCRAWLAYLTPLVADATAAEGTFSLSLQESAISLSDLSHATLGGALQIHEGRVGPGPLANSILRLVDQVRGLAARTSAEEAVGERWLTLPEQQVDFALTDGRVHHRRLQVQAGRVTLQTTGSVGLDESLDLQVQLPLSEEWFDRPALAKAFGGKVLTLPVGGTVSQPEIDPGTLKQLAKEFGTQAVESLIDTGVEKALNRLFERRERKPPRK